MAIQFEETPGWTFDLEELSPNVFKVTGRDPAGRVFFEKTGLDTAELVNEAKDYGMQVIADLKVRGEKGAPKE
jgi:hypothetical protein